MSKTTATAMEVKALNIFFGGNHAVNDVSLKIESEKINAIVGPNGSGKSTLFNLISKVYTPTSGTVVLEGEDITQLPDFLLANPSREKSISRTFQETPMFPYLTVKQHLQLAMSVQDESFFKSFFSPKLVCKDDMKKILSLVGLEIPLDKQASELSYGQKKLLSFALAIAKPHNILMIDEPVSGVNPKLRKSIAEMLLKMKAEHETILLIEHDMNFVFSIADNVTVMDSGAIIFHGTPKEARENAKVLAAYLGG